MHTFKTAESGIGFDFDVAFEPNQKINCIIGKNGIGKTQLLENMAKSLLFSHSIFHNRNKELKFGGMFLHEIIYKKLKDFELKLPLRLEINGIGIKDEVNQPWGYSTFENLPLYVNHNFICDTPVIFIGAKNRGFTKNIDPDNIKILGNAQNRFVESFTRTMSYINGIGLEHEEIANWFVSRLIINPNFVVADQNKSNEVMTVLKLIEQLEPSLTLVTRNTSGGNSLAMLYHEGQLFINDIPLDKLSTGFVSIVKIFQEIVAGYGGWSNLEDLSQVEGIVFIDEIEPHLHISWQTKIIKILRESFPNTTFYISTHSPLVLAGLKDGEAYELVKEGNFVKTKAIKNVDNYALNDIVNEFFGVDLNREKVDHPNLEKQKKARALLLNLTKSLDEDES